MSCPFHELLKKEKAPDPETPDPELHDELEESKREKRRIPVYLPKRTWRSERQDITAADAVAEAEAIIAKGAQLPETVPVEVQRVLRSAEEDLAGRVKGLVDKVPVAVPAAAIMLAIQKLGGKPPVGGRGIPPVRLGGFGGFFVNWYARLQRMTQLRRLRRLPGSPATQGPGLIW